MKIEEILGDPTGFLEKIFINLKNDGIDVSDYELDHVCYRVETLENHKFLKNELLKIGILISENKVKERLIPLIKLKKPIIFRNRKIYIIELPEPSQHNNYKEGFEHIEFVILESFEDFIGRYKNLKFDTNAISKEINPDIVRNYKDCAVKFHHHTLEYVVKYLDK